MHHTSFPGFLRCSKNELNVQTKVSIRPIEDLAILSNWIGNTFLVIEDAHCYLSLKNLPLLQKSIFIPKSFMSSNDQNTSFITTVDRMLVI